MAELPEPDLSGESNWKALALPGLLTKPTSFVSGDPEGQRLRVKYYHDEAANKIISQVWFGPGVEGPPGHAHGGSIASVLDEVMGMAAFYAGHTVVAANISINFLHLLPLNSVTSAYAWVDRVEGRKVHTKCTLLGPDGTTYGDGSGLFITLSFNKITSLLQ